MFTSNTKDNSETNTALETIILDPLTLWLIRIACVLIIILFSGLLLGIPILISLVKSQVDISLLNLKDYLKTLIELALS